MPRYQDTMIDKQLHHKQSQFNLTMKAINSDKSKTLRHFAVRIINVASKDQRWSTQGLVDLFRLVSEELNFDSKSALKCLKQLPSKSTPKLVSALMKQKVIQISLKDVLDIMIDQANNLDELCHMIEECIHHKTIDITSKESLLELKHVITKVTMTELDTDKYQAFLCEMCPSKAAVGRLLLIFIGPPSSSADTASFATTSSQSVMCDNDKLRKIYNIVTSEPFKQMDGSLKSFYYQLKHYESQLHSLLMQNGLVDKSGDLKDLDIDSVDSNGNLRNLIASSDDESSSTERREGSHNSDSSSDSEDTDTTVSSQPVKKHFSTTKTRRRTVDKRSISSSSSSPKQKMNRLKKKRQYSTLSSDEDLSSDEEVVTYGNKKTFSKQTIKCFDLEAAESSSCDESFNLDD